MACPGERILALTEYIHAVNLSFSYQNEPEAPQVLKDVSLSVEKGSFVAVLGHNGSGKSTLAKHMNVILLPSGGSLFVNGMDTSLEEHLWEIRQQVGMVFQNPDNQLVATVVEEDVAFAPENMGVPPEEIRRRVEEALRTVGMWDFRDHAPHRLSGGQKQRIAIAGVLAMHPDCIVLDEPTAMLDPRGRREVLETIHRLNRESGMTVILITHYMDEAAQADRVVVMDSGTVIADGTPKEVFSQVELIRSAGLDVPQTTDLVHWLRTEKGLDLPADCLTVEEAADAVAKLFS
ncbi:MAG: energy-coupling factor transporter ATPase [Oscillospiraceae bacterium]|nr:energy-coupling factor transporter ATPase [Oscillospiraceae bacterium]MBQ8732068.1 energy-coupling factor transporter ATPase [Oscillospiraceae bacterium]